MISTENYDVQVSAQHCRVRDSVLYCDNETERIPVGNISSFFVGSVEPFFLNEELPESE